MATVAFDAVDLGPGVRAGFTRRGGGVSAPPWDGLNVGLAVGDDPAAVVRNRRLLADRVGAPVVFATQVHGRGVVVVDGAAAGGAAAAGVAEADAVVTTSPEVAVGVYVADCVPVLLADRAAGVVAAAHAGRPGLVAGVLQATVAAMVALGARPERVRAVLGPCIAGESYEVPAGMRAEVAAVVPEAAARTRDGAPAVDLRAGALAVLARCGVASVQVDRRDTYADPELYSHRRAVHAAPAGPRTGRFAGVVRLLPS
ncbi:peptidoglycan editing factor PgeF [Cellulomonas shaoxiangyii]|uniref:Purine nucleoside phosphorylase n=1 Tax=Cellulomonas shaoxiangyii TaxID=2566013 RepID=A0A4V1CMR7_9CELL|nr:peptidoglycan editing factor PgeF [Cellulomonas shaoxiangyii]QCB93885.1 peptidoglycan editing factor PgeF [Cellulomonas shaoxiangyii]TGY83203.1 peptidoglycan editing factor PgeF [Cellulomonas shaoxiangyii]